MLVSAPPLPLAAPPLPVSLPSGASTASSSAAAGARVTPFQLAATDTLHVASPVLAALLVLLEYGSLLVVDTLQGPHLIRDIEIPEMLVLALQNLVR